MTKEADVDVAVAVDWGLLLSHTPVPTLVLDESFCILSASKSYIALSKATSNILIGTNIHDSSLDTQQDQGPNNLLLPTVDAVRTAVKEAIRAKTVYVHPDIESQDEHVYSIRAIPIYNDDDRLCYVKVEVENTTKEFQRKQELNQRLSTSETFRILVETVKDYAIFMLDTKGNVSTWNTGAELLKGFAPSDIIGRHFSNFYGDEDRKARKPWIELEVALQDGRVEDEGWRYRKDGTRFWANVILTPVYRNGTLIGFSKVTRDLTERKAAEARLAAAYEESSKLKSEFLANMSHEIRTPMHGALSALTLLMETDLNPEQRDLANIIDESGTVLLHVINDILDYSKLASGTFSISADVLSISDIINSVVRNFQTALGPKTNLEIFLDPALPATAQGDPLRYRQIVQNLLANAAKFTEEGYVKVRAKVTDEDESHCTILTEIIDTGIGIPAFSINTLFTPFTQFDTSATKRYKGTGLGLSICKSLAELMGGNIGFRPNPEGKGSIFWFTCEVRKFKDISPSEDDKERIIPIITEKDLGAEIRKISKGKRILLAEDNVINRKVMVKMLNGLDITEIDTVGDGMQAVSLACDTSRKYSLILMDINMPLLDGVGATIEIRNAGKRTPIIAMTANALKGHAELYMAKGLSDYVPKPVDRKLLFKVLLRWLKDVPPSSVQSMI
ncbi:sensor histidine kinase-like protein/response regulator Fos-1 [Patellaria atrata CBS 101060]|uniref:Sensor histidine kinase-like protein/response regulator Fos-1 n=1 Tax=Patellaria atrata CBS 101060 TaxID=1346257 RepID=A0A9P4VMG4_9PEZI|nr:sensor histidine kinase-like protein/response regulator Fos-1 [Patellaria atrata CBS 101060]